MNTALTTIFKNIKPLTLIFWITLHTITYITTTLILTTLGKTTLLTPETTTALTYLKTTATLYYRQLAITTVETYAYQLTPYWEFLTQTALETALQLTHNPAALATITILAMITAIIRYTLVLYLLRVETTTTPPRTAAYQQATQAAALLAPASTQPPKPKTFLHYLRRFSGFLVHLILK